jgi:cyclic pyranopterin monophosphate synthase
MSGFSHIDDQQRPTMVDVGDKHVTKRSATAESRVLFPAAVATALSERGFNTSKGPVFQTAIIAGVMAAKKTHELIPSAIRCPSKIARSKSSCRAMPP